MGLGSSGKYGLVFLPIIVYVAIQFAFAQLGVLILIGLLITKLYSYRFANAVLSRTTFR